MKAYEAAKTRLFRSKIVLAVLLCAFALSLSYRLIYPYKQPRVEKKAYGNEATRKKIPSAKPAVESGPGPDDLLSNPPRHNDSVIRNPFFEETPAKKEVAAEEKPEAGHVQSDGKPDENRLLVQKEISEYKMLGYVEEKGARSVFLERNNQLLIVREGDRINGKYLVKEITDGMMTLHADLIDEDIHLDFRTF